VSLTAALEETRRQTESLQAEVSELRHKLTEAGSGKCGVLTADAWRSRIVLLLRKMLR